MSSTKRGKHSIEKLGGALALARDTRGALTTEYVALVGLVALSVIFGLLAIGPYLVEHYQNTRNIVASPYP